MPGLKRHRTPMGGDETSSDVDSTNESFPQHSSHAASEDEDLSELDEATEQLYATQYHREQLAKRGKENPAAENGIIESVECNNFMCHAYLHVDIGPLINFIIGHNGSGKSAVLTALTICLGGKASATNRGGSLKSFIKEGEDTCTLKVKIRNGGETGYQPDIYGSSITVERTFNRAGASGFKLKNANDRLVSTRKGDLEEISDYYALQLDNPISVLTQDQARQFLSGASPVEKYRFFVKGVQLEQLYNDYELLAESIAQAEATFADKKAQIAALQTKRDRAKELLDMVGRQREVRRKIEHLAVQMAWSQVEEQERTLRFVNEDIGRIDREISQAQNETAQAGTSYDVAESTKSQASDALRRAEEEKGPLEVEKQDVKKKNEDAKAEGQSIQNQQRNIKGELKACEKKIETANAEIAEEERRLEELHGGSLARRHTELDGLRSAARTAKATYEEHKKKKVDLAEDRARAEALLKECKVTRGPKLQNVRDAEQRLKALRARTDKKDAYPTGMEQLEKAIQRNSGFLEQPVGPIGNFVMLKRPVWSKILEKSFGATLTAFVVTSKEDQQRLSNIMRRVKCIVPIFIGGTSNFEFSNYEPEPGYETILRALKIEHPLVLRQLIINHNIEQIILIENMDRARDTIMGSRVRNVKACYSLQPGNSGLGERFAYGADNSVSTSYMDVHQGLPRMQLDVEDQLRFETESLEKAQAELGDHDASQREFERSVDSCQESLDAHEARSKELQITSQRAEDEVEDLMEKLDADKVEEGRLEALKDGLEAAKRTKHHLKNSYQDSVVAKDEHLVKKRELLTELNDCDERLAAIDKRIEEAQEACNKAEEERLIALVKKNEAVKKAEDLQSDRLTRQEDLEKQTKQTNEFIRQASDIGARVPVDHGETTDSLDKKLQKLDADQTRFAERIGGNTEKISNDYSEAFRAHKAAAEQVAEDENLVTLFKETYQHRKYRWEQFKKYITARARITFSHFLSERGFQGKLTINHKDKLLDINVQPDETQRDRQGRQTKTLSGGEKSFSQICLLLSLWEAIGAPIRCLDEFDVFMDSVNREASMKLLIKAARDSIGRQFVLITPQSMASIDATHDVKIIKMRDPERNQGTLRFGGRGEAAPA